MATNKAKIEAALFVSDSPLDIVKLAKFVNGDEDEAEKIVNELKSEYEKDGRGFELVNTPEGYEFRIKKEYRDNVAELAPFSDLSEGMLRTLAIVAAKQPIKQSTIVKYQGNKVYNYISKLEDKGLIRTEKFGRTKLITTTDGFEKYFGKSVEEVKKMLTTKMGTKDEEIENKASEKLPGEDENGL